MGKQSIKQKCDHCGDICFVEDMIHPMDTEEWYCPVCVDQLVLLVNNDGQKGYVLREGLEQFLADYYDEGWHTV